MVQETSFGNDRDQKTKRTATVTKGTRGNVSHKVRTQSISQERGTRLSSFVLRRMFTKGDPSLPHTMTSVPGSSVLFRLKRDRGLMRDSTWESSRQTFPDSCSVTQSYVTLCDPLDCTMPGFSVLRHLPEIAQTHVH